MQTYRGTKKVNKPWCSKSFCLLCYYQPKNIKRQVTKVFTSSPVTNHLMKKGLPLSNDILSLLKLQAFNENH